MTTWPSKRRARWMELKNQKYDYVEDVGDAGWDLTTESTGTMDGANWMAKQTMSVTRWGTAYVKPTYGHKKTMTRDMDDLLAYLESTRMTKKEEALGDIHMQQCQEETIVKSDLIPIIAQPPTITPFQGCVAKHKRIGELLGVAKPVGPWNQQQQHHAHVA